VITCPSLPARGVGLSRWLMSSRRRGADVYGVKASSFQEPTQYEALPGTSQTTRARSFPTLTKIGISQKTPDVSRSPTNRGFRYSQETRSFDRYNRAVPPTFLTAEPMIR